ncbi:hypothetical protein B0H19DRAFT_1229592 [Mycena capillaripes]|nr:hypothetical protein B0H19DRAFT_1229592 [Mycena capillaripes]
MSVEVGASMQNAGDPKAAGHLHRSTLAFNHQARRCHYPPLGVPGLYAPDPVLNVFNSATDTSFAIQRLVAIKSNLPWAIQFTGRATDRLLKRTRGLTSKILATSDATSRDNNYPLDPQAYFWNSGSYRLLWMQARREGTRLWRGPVSKVRRNHLKLFWIRLWGHRPLQSPSACFYDSRTEREVARSLKPFLSHTTAPSPHWRFELLVEAGPCIPKPAAAGSASVSE